MQNANQKVNETEGKDDAVIEGAIVEVKPDNALVVMDPEKYATELFASFNQELTVAKRRAGREKYDVTTKAGMETAKELRALFVKIRTRADKTKTEAKRPIDIAGKAILARFGVIKVAAEVEEAKHNQAIVDQEAKIEAEKQRKIEEQRVRTEEIQNRIAHIRGIPVMMVNSSSADVAAKIESLVEKRLEPSMYDDHLEDAVNALNATIDALRLRHTEALEREEAARVAEANRLELERLRSEKEEADRVAAANQVAQAEALAAVQRQQAQMMEIMAVQNLAAVAGEREIVAAALDQARAFDPATYGAMQPMATMARDMALAALVPLLDSMPVPEVEEVPAKPVMHRTVTSPVTPVRYAPAPAAPVDLGPTDAEIIEVVADHFSWTYEEAAARLAKIPH